MKTITKTLLLALASSTLFAQNGVEYKNYKVKYSTPKYTKIQYSQPVEVCQEVQIPKYSYASQSHNSIGIDTIIGATAGVVIGNQIGGGSGRDAAKIVGGLLGAKMANSMRKPKRHLQGYETQTQCNTSYETEYKNEISGYENHFYIDGIKHMKFSQTPLKRVRVKITRSYSY